MSELLQSVSSWITLLPIVIIAVIILGVAIAFVTDRSMARIITTIIPVGIALGVMMGVVPIMTSQLQEINQEGQPATTEYADWSPPVEQNVTQIEPATDEIIEQQDGLELLDLGSMNLEDI